MSQRIISIGKATKAEVVVVEDGLLEREAAYTNKDVISAFISGCVKLKKNLIFFMLDFAEIVEANILLVLRDSLGFYYGNDLEDFKLGLGIKKISTEGFKKMVSQAYTPEKLKILCVLESRKFAAKVLESLRT